MMFAVLRPLAIALVLLGTRPGLAEEVALYLMEVPPMTINDPLRKGAVGDVTLEAMKRAGMTAQLIVEPSNRAMQSVKESRGALIIPLARLKDREADYTWIAPVVRVNRAFFALRDPAGTFADARQRYKAIAVSRGTAGVSILRDNGFRPEQIVEVKQGDTAPKMLLLERVDAWFNLVSESQLLLREADPERRVKMGEPLGPSFNYIACSKVCDPRQIERLRSAVHSMEKDGTLAAIKARYGLSE